MDIHRNFLSLSLFLSLIISAGNLYSQETDTTLIDRDSLASDQDENLPDFVTSVDVLDNEIQSQDVSSLLQSSRDAFTSIAGYNFSAARFRIRGYSSENYVVMMNGMKLNDMESGWAIWSYWGGLNDITRYQNSKTGVSSSQLHFGGIGGFSNITVRASKLRKGSRFSYALTNRTYRHRAMFTHSTGMMDNGLAVSVSGSGRYSNEGYVDGTYYEGGSYFLSIEKKINDEHSIGFVGLGAPTISARQSISVQEIYDLTDDNYYNSYWGYQDGKKRNSRVRNYHKPLFMLSHYWDIDEKSELKTSVMSFSGKSGYTRLNWVDAKDPRPNYYRYLPSYFEDDPTKQQQVTQAWQNDPSTSQIDWDHLYFANSKNLYTVEDANGEEGNDVTGNRSKYILEDQHVDPTQYGVNSVYNTALTEKIHLSAGVNLHMYKSRNYKIAQDLLGGDYWVDIDQFAKRDFSSDSATQTDLATPNEIIEQGEDFGYDYVINVNKAELFSQAEFTFSRVDGYVGLTGSQTSFWRTGNVRNGLYPETSYGDSEKQNFTNYGVKAGINYKITGRHIVTFNGSYSTRAPYSRNAFVSPRTRPELAQGLTDEKILSGDLNYIIRYPNLKMRLTAYYTEINDQVWSRSFYHDEFRTFVNYTMTDVDHLYMGTEFGLRVNLTPTVELTSAFAMGEFLWNSRPKATVARNNSDSLLADDRTVYLKNFKLGGMPQTAASVGLKYNSPKYWYFGANVNYFDDIYLQPSPDRRTEESLEKYVESDPQVEQILDQEKLGKGYTVNVFGGKSWKISDGRYIRININVSNVLNNTNFRTGGFEQYRFDESDPDRFPSKYSYMYGLTYFAMVNFLF